jgi:hypothetical protein
MNRDRTSADSPSGAEANSRPEPPRSTLNAMFGAHARVSAKPDRAQAQRSRVQVVVIASSL